MRPTSAHLGVPRRRHLAALSALFLQVLKLCERAGLVKLGHVALDGTGGFKGVGGEAISDAEKATLAGISSRRRQHLLT
jgi:hypothetical protein